MVDLQKLKHDIIMYGAFVTPPVAILLVFYVATHNVFWSVIGTVITIVTCVIAISYWWMKKTEDGVSIIKK